MRSLVLLGSLQVVLLCSSLVLGQQSADEEGAHTSIPANGATSNWYRFGGSYLLRYSRVSLFPLTEPSVSIGGVSYPHGFYDGLQDLLDHRLRLKASVRLAKGVWLHAGGDLAGQLVGDTTWVGKGYLLEPRDRNRFYARSMLRRLYVEWLTPFGMVRFGQMLSEWGMGLVANGGKDREGEFYNARFGDVVDRLLFATRPFASFSSSEFARHFYVAVGTDLVFRDDIGSVLEGDWAVEGIGSLFYDGPAGKGQRLFLGFYGAYRHQWFSDDDRLWAAAFDVYLRYRIPVLGSSEVRLESEWAYVLGRLDFAEARGPPRAAEDVDIRSHGGAARVSWEWEPAGVIPSFEVGLASGDGDPTDGVSTAMAFDPDYQVGMLIFQEVLGRMSALAPMRVADPYLVYQPPAGYKLGATNGAITNAFYLYPKMRYRPQTGPLKGLEVVLGFLWARALAPVASVYNTAAHGGYPLGYRVDPLLWGNRPWDSKDLGIEVLGGVGYTLVIMDGARVSLGVQLGWCRPGSAFADANGNRLGDLSKLRLLADLRW